MFSYSIKGGRIQKYSKLATLIQCLTQKEKINQSLITLVVALINVITFMNGCFVSTPKRV
jgi:hypothetical protein